MMKFIVFTVLLALFVDQAAADAHECGDVAETVTFCMTECQSCVDGDACPEACNPCGDEAIGLCILSALGEDPDALGDLFGDAITDAIGDALGPDCAGAEFAALLASCTGCDENGGNIGTDACPIDCASLGLCFDGDGDDDGDDDDFEATPELFAALIPQFCAADCGDEIAACGGDSFNAGCMEALTATFASDGVPPTSSSDFLALFQCVDSASCMPDDDDDGDDDDDDGAAVQAFVVDQIVANTDLDQSAATALVTGIAANLDLPDDFDFTTIFENDVVVAALTANGVSATEIEAMDSAAESTDFDELTSGGNDSTGGGSNPGGGGDDDDDSAASAAVGLATVVGLTAALF